MENSGSLMDQQQIEAITQNDTVQYSEHMKGIERIYASAGRMLADISIPLTNQRIRPIRPPSLCDAKCDRGMRAAWRQRI